MVLKKIIKKFNSLVDEIEAQKAIFNQSTLSKVKHFFPLISLNIPHFVTIVLLIK